MAAVTGVKFAVVDVNEFLTQKQAAEPELATDWAELEELYNKKLWHQLTLKLMNFVKHSSLQKGDSLIQLYNNFLSTFENKINPLSLVEILSNMLPQYKNKHDAIAFLEKAGTKVKANDEALTLCKVLQGQIYLEQLNDLDSTEKIINELEGSLEDADGVTPVHGKFYKLASEYYRVRGPMGKYYRCTLRWVGCLRGGQDLALAERAATAKSLALAGVCSSDVYDLGELLAHPILSSVEGTADAWAIELVKAVYSGDVAAYERLRPELNADLRRADTVIRQKIAILCLMEMAFNRTSAQRKLRFSEIAARARVPHDEVELLIMKALAEKLIKGHIDQVGEVAIISWIRPRCVVTCGAASLAARVGSWGEAVAGAIQLIHTHATDQLLTA